VSDPEPYAGLTMLAYLLQKIQTEKHKGTASLLVSSQPLPLTTVTAKSSCWFLTESGDDQEPQKH